MTSVNNDAIPDHPLLNATSQPITSSQQLHQGTLVRGVQSSEDSFVKFVVNSVTWASTNGSNEREMSEIDRSKSLWAVNSPKKTDDTGGFDDCPEYSYFTEEDEEDEVLQSPQRLTLWKAPKEIQKKDTPMDYVLGKTYHPDIDLRTKREDECTLFWFTYRADFPEIKPYGITSDAGWGCMLRSTQMLMGQTLRLHFKSRDWRPPRSFINRRRDPFVRSMLTWFADFPSADGCVYSLHNMVACGYAYDILPGEWYGPGSACYVLRDLVDLHNQQMGGALQLKVHVTTQGAVYRDQISQLCAILPHPTVEEKAATLPLSTHPLDDSFWSTSATDVKPKYMEWHSALLLLIPLRLGLKSFNRDYFEVVAYALSLPQSVGILGGKPRGARWFYGASSDGKRVFGLDPHTVQQAPSRRNVTVNGQLTSVVQLSDQYLRSIHTCDPEVASLLSLDPSIALGFYCRNETDLNYIMNNLKMWGENHPKSPSLFTFDEKSPGYAASVDELLSSSALVDADQGEDNSDEEDEFVLL